MERSIIYPQGSHFHTKEGGMGGGGTATAEKRIAVNWQTKKDRRTLRHKALLATKNLKARGAKDMVPSSWKGGGRGTNLGGQTEEKNCEKGERGTGKEKMQRWRAADCPAARVKNIGVIAAPSFQEGKGNGRGGYRDAGQRTDVLGHGTAR